MTWTRPPRQTIRRRTRPTTRAPLSWPTSPGSCRPPRPRSGLGSPKTASAGGTRTSTLIRAREKSEAKELRVLAEGDVKAIDSWADTEIERIQSERERRTTSRRGELAQRLEDHRLLIGREVDAVEAAIAAYRTEVEVYFSRLDAETDPVAIAREAGRRPQFPDLGRGRAGDRRRPTPPPGRQTRPALPEMTDSRLRATGRSG